MQNLENERSIECMAQGDETMSSVVHKRIRLTAVETRIPNRHITRPPGAFTLVELLVVIAIIAILMPSLQKAK